MSFPKEPVVLSQGDLTSADVLIEDRMLAALKGSPESSSASSKNSAGKLSFYSQLIESLAKSIYEKKCEDESDWTLESLKNSADRILTFILSRNNKRRFIWKKVTEQVYIQLTHEQTVNKVANDLHCQIRKLSAAASSKASPRQDGQSPDKAASETQLHYAHCLIYIVCLALKSGMSPYRAAFSLDRPPFLHQVSLSSPSDLDDDGAAEGNAHDAQQQQARYEESSRERGLRLQLRQRFLACVRTNKPLLEMCNSLLRMWKLPEFDMNQKPKPRVAKLAPRKPTSTVEPELEPVVVDDKSKASNDCGGQDVGVWRATERKAFLEAIEVHSIGKWSLVAPLIPNRSKQQVTRYGLYIKKKFALNAGDFPTDKLRKYLLRCDDDNVGANKGSR